MYRILIEIRIVIIFSLVVLATVYARAASHYPRYYIQSNPLPTHEHVVELANKLSKNQFVIYGQQLASVFELPNTKASLRAWASGIHDGVVIIWNPNRIEQSVGFSSLMRTIDSFDRVAVLMVGFHSPSDEVMKVTPLKIEKLQPNCQLHLNWLDSTKKISK